MSDEEKVVETTEPAAVQPAAAAPEPAKPEKAEPAEEPYDYFHCTIQIGIQLLPNDGNAEGRPVIVGVRNHADAPIVKMMRYKTLGTLPLVINDMLNELHASMPARQKAHEEAVAKKKAEDEAAKARADAARARIKAKPKAKPQAHVPDYGADEEEDDKPQEAQVLKPAPQSAIESDDEESEAPDTQQFNLFGVLNG